VLIILVSFILLYIWQEGRDLLKNGNWQEALLGLTIIAVSMVYGIDYMREGDALPHPGMVLEQLQPLVDIFSAFFKLSA
jgi:hypothetical protein